ncbi:MAG: IS110 family transposase [Candidatus Acidiferrales bacterium]
MDLHVRTQSVCWCDTTTGEQKERTLDHERDDVRAFYAELATPAIVGVEASGYSLWFHQLIEQTGHRLLVGDALAIRQFARRRQKNDRRDARLLLDLLLHDDFPAVHVPPPTSRDVLALLRYRHRLVRMRTMLRNGLQAVALGHQLRLGPRLFTVRGQEQFAALPLAGAYAAQRQHSLVLLASLAEQIRAIEADLQTHAHSDARVIRLRTHPGVGPLTALAVVHALEPVTRFDRARRIAAYCGLDPKEHSSGDTQRFGHISKQGNRLLRFLLIEAARTTIRDDEDLRRFYFHLEARKNSAVAIVAVARKLVLRLYRMLREEIDYDEFRRRGRDARRAREFTSQAASG